ncbi:MAG: GGDEF domain-containing protein [Tardiphaga sp.]|jgi:diguanylate cyclase (GGDEF)-like protein
MQIDSFTVLLFGLFIKLVLGSLFLVFWYKQRSAAWYVWWAATLLLACAATVLFAVRGFTADLFAIGIGNVALIAALVCNWQAARVFNHVRPLWMPIVTVPSLWFAACLVPAFIENTAYRVVLSSLIAASLLALAAYEMWRGRSEQLPSRWPVIVLFSTFSLFFVSRIALVGVLPFPFGALPMQPGSVGAFNLIMFFHTLLITVLIVAMSKERLEFDQRVKAQTDPLTGALNRRALMSRGDRLLRRHSVEQKPLCLLFLDLDDFKSLNDRFGHSGGDDVLMKFVAVVHDNIRPTDFLFRIGGEEFCCLLPHTGATQAHRVADRIRHQFEAAAVDVAGATVRTTVSLGIASTETFGYDLDTLMRRADMAVYEAKQQGRNRVVVARSDDPAQGTSRIKAVAV